MALLLCMRLLVWAMPKFQGNLLWSIDNKTVRRFNLFTYVLFSVISDTFFISKQNGSKFRSSRTDQLTVPVNKLSEITVIVIYGQPLHLELFINSRKCNHILHINDMRAKSAKFRKFTHNRQTN